MLNHCWSSTFEAGCNCIDSDTGWCKHSAALAYNLIHICQTKPLTFLHGIGLDIPHACYRSRNRCRPCGREALVVRTPRPPAGVEDLCLSKRSPCQSPSLPPPLFIVVDYDLPQGTSMHDPISLDE